MYSGCPLTHDCLSFSKNYQEMHEQPRMKIEEGFMTKSFQFGLDKIASAFQKRADDLFNQSN